MPDEEELPPGPRRNLTVALHSIYAKAGKPPVRKISAWIRGRDDLKGTLSHEGVSAVLRGENMPRWENLESLVRVLVENQCFGHPDVEFSLGNILDLWHIADGGDSLTSSDQDTDPPASRSEVIAQWHSESRVLDIRDRQVVMEIFKEFGGFNGQL